MDLKTDIVRLPCTGASRLAPVRPGRTHHTIPGDRVAVDATSCYSPAIPRGRRGGHPEPSSGPPRFARLQGVRRAGFSRCPSIPPIRITSFLPCPDNCIDGPPSQPERSPSFSDATRESRQEREPAVRERRRTSGRLGCSGGMSRGAGLAVPARPLPPRDPRRAPWALIRWFHAGAAWRPPAGLLRVRGSAR